ncbi:MAG: hypothetical protein ACYC5O_04880 [Anaerolineae bacterium]
MGMKPKHSRRWIAIPILLFLAALGIVLPTVPERLAAQGSGDDALTGEAIATNARMGICFVSSAEDRADDARYGRAVASGAQWNRYPFYWQNIERSSGSYDYAAQDTAVRDDVAHGMRTLAILLGTPGVYATGGVAGAEMPLVSQNLEVEIASGKVSAQDFPVSAASSAPSALDQPVFSDGTDVPGAGKTINPNNPWARFVYNTVNRYKPGGVLAQQQGWPADTGILHWEMWNEADLAWFWSGSVQQYYRLLKVGYLAAKFADPRCAVMLGGLAYNDGGSWFGSLLSTMAADGNSALRDANYQYFNILGLHAYSRSADTIDRPANVRARLASYGLTKRIWVTEMGVPVWNDYPGPTNDPNSLYRATTAEQAAYVIQAHAYAMYSSVEYMFYFQLHDDCGNGADAHDAYGLFRNASSGACYPSDAGVRPSYTAYQLVAQYFRDVTPLWRLTPNGTHEIIAFNKTGTNERLLVMWATGGSSVQAQVTAASASATLIDVYGHTQKIAAQNGVYSITLPAATNTNLPDDSYMIGGLPYILIENAPGYIADELATNGSFEAGFTGWTTGGSTAPQAGSQCQAGTGCALLGSGFVADPGVSGDPGTHGGNSTLLQTVVLDPLVESPRLRFHYRIANEETDGAKGWLEVIVIDTSTSPAVATYVVPTQTLYTSCGWTWKQIDLTPWRGKQVQIVFNVYQSSAERPTLAWVDNVSVGDLYMTTILPMVKGGG